MTIYENLQAEIKTAMINKNAVKRDCLKLVLSDVKNQTINAGKEITDEIVLKCIQKSVKQHNDSIESFKNGGREDLAEKEKEELSYLAPYLPKMLSEDETLSLIKDIIAKNGIATEKRNMGLIMKSLPSTVDKKLASKLITSLLT